MYFEIWSRMRSVMFQFPQRDLRAGQRPAIVHDSDTGCLETDKLCLGVPPLGFPRALVFPSGSGRAAGVCACARRRPSPGRARAARAGGAGAPGAERAGLRRPGISVHLGPCASAAAAGTHSRPFLCWVCPGPAGQPGAGGPSGATWLQSWNCSGADLRDQHCLSGQG